MAKHTLTFSRSEGHQERVPNPAPDIVDVTVEGWVGLTFDYLRIDPDIYRGDHLAQWNGDGSWEILTDELTGQGLGKGFVFSDVTIIDDFGNDTEPREIEPGKHPIDLGQSLNGGAVIAWGYFREPGDGPPDNPGETTLLSVMTLLDAERRVANEKNYEVFLYEVETGRFANVQYFPNIVPTVRAYEDEFGMDY